MLHIRMNIGIVPEGSEFIALAPPVINSIGSTMSTTAMNKNRISHTDAILQQGWLWRFFFIIGNAEVLIRQFRSQAPPWGTLYKTQL